MYTKPLSGKLVKYISARRYEAIVNVRDTPIGSIEGIVSLLPLKPETSSYSLGM
jgi:hypothetical protein